jgi:hypothetical protein
VKPGAITVPPTWTIVTAVFVPAVAAVNVHSSIFAGTAVLVAPSKLIEYRNQFTPNWAGAVTEMTVFAVAALSAEETPGAV